MQLQHHNQSDDPAAAAGPVQLAFMYEVLLCRVEPRRLDMSENIKSEVLSRRSALSFLGLTALSLAVPTMVAVPTVLTVSDTKAQPATPPAATPGTTQTGTERRQERRIERTERRQERRTRRMERRLTRREGRRERRLIRREGRRERREERREVR